MESFAKILNGWNLSQTSNMNIWRIGYVISRKVPSSMFEKAPNALLNVFLYFVFFTGKV